MAENKYESITKYINQFNRKTFGKLTEQTGEGTKEKPYIMRHFIYDSDVSDFKQEFYNLDIADKNYIENITPIKEKKIADLSESELITKLTFFIRGDRFCEGCLRGALEDGTICEILQRLKTF